MSALRTFVAALGATILLASAHVSADSPATHVYTARHRTPEELAPLAQAVLGEEGVAAVDAGSLVLIGAPDAVRRAAKILEARDIAQKLVTLYLELRSTATLSSAGYQIRWQREGDLRTGVLQTRRAGARSISTGSREHTGFSLRVRDGATGRIDIGRSVPVVSRWLFGGSTTIVEASSELVATPRVLGNGQISVQLVWSRRDVDDAGRTGGDGGRTTVVLRPNEVIALGALSRKLDSPASRTYGARSRRAHSDEQVILLRMEVD